MNSSHNFSAKMASLYTMCESEREIDICSYVVYCPNKQIVAVASINNKKIPISYIYLIYLTKLMTRHYTKHF